MSEVLGTQGVGSAAVATSSAGAARRVLVTGSSGYLGTLVVRALAADRQSVEQLVAVDVRAPKETLPGVVYQTLDVRDTGLSALVAKHAIDCLVHLAAIVSPGPASSRELEYSIDVLGTRNVLLACVANGVRQLIVTSSGAAYGYHADNDALLTEDSPLRGNEEFAYSRHKRLVEDELARCRTEHPSLGQLVFRPGTVLGQSVKNQITAMFERPVVVGVAGFATPFVFIWDQDVVGCILHGLRTGRTGTYNLAGDGVMTLREIASALCKPYVAIAPRALAGLIGVLGRYGLTRYGPEQVLFLQYRPVLSNERLKTGFGYAPKKTTREVFTLYQSGLEALRIRAGA